MTEVNSDHGFGYGSPQDVNSLSRWGRNIVTAISNLVGLFFTWIIWLWLIGLSIGPAGDAVVVAVSTLGTILLVFVGRWLLDRQPTKEQAYLIAFIVRYLIVVLIGSAILSTVRFALSSLEWQLPVQPWLGPVTIMICGLALAVLFFNLLLSDRSGFGFSYAYRQIRVVVSRWLFGWMLNPAACETCFVSILAFLVGLGIWLKSGLFLIWFLAVVIPAILFLLKIYEEREIEIRFGKGLNDQGSVPG